ncbi:MAG TPA: hypothetical protein VEU78_11255 [Steroidobacteraceae bacterium]|nr:hypothetical protein [Steroidobacteraceae bacterium]
MSMTINTLSSAIAAAGALGTASFGIVEGLKWTALGAAGFGCIGEYLGQDLTACLRSAYGPEFERLLRAQYRQDSRSQSIIAKSLRQGVRIGLTTANAENVARFLGTVAPAALRQAAAAVESSTPLSDAERGAIGRFELAADARIASALSRAQDVYLGWVRGSASLCAIVLGIATALILGSDLVDGLIVGVVAVPLAPIANDVVAALQAATRAMRGG